MARFVSPHGNYSHGVRAGQPERMGLNGVMLPAVPALKAQFETDWRQDEDIALAKSVFNFRGLAIYENGQHVEPTYRISVFDSELAKLKYGWTDEDTEIVVEALRNNGPIGQMYVEVIPAPAEKPWNGYDELDDATRIVELATAINADLEKVMQYERENQKRPEVIGALKAEIDDANETIIVSA